MGKFKDLTGMIFGRLTAIDKIGANSHRQIMWRCVCGCPDKTEVTVVTSSLVNGATKSCGCLNKELLRERALKRQVDLTGLKFGRLTAISVSNEKGYNNCTKWVCKCDCPEQNTVVVSARNLQAGTTKSCGCLQRETISKIRLDKGEDLTGMPFGRLTVISRADSRGPRGETLWNCECNCDGKIIIARAHNLQSGDTKSCGCLNTERTGAMGRASVAKRREAHIDREIEDLKFLGKSHVSELTLGDIRENGDIFIRRVKREGGRISANWLNKGLAERFFSTKALRSCVRGALARGKSVKSFPTEYILCASIDFARNHIAAQFTENMSWENYGEWHFDHYIPMAYSKTQPDPQYADEILNHYSNFRPLWGPENLSKSDTFPDNVDDIFAELKIKVEKFRAENQK